MAEKKYETEFTWGKGVQPPLQEDALTVKHLASLKRRQGNSENRNGKVAPDA